MAFSGFVSPHVEMFRPSVLLVLLLLLRASPAAALTGRVVNADGLPIVGAEISILGRPGTATTEG